EGPGAVGRHRELRGAAHAPGHHRPAGAGPPAAAGGRRPGMTYSIVAIDPASGRRGVAVASKALCVGAHVRWGAPGLCALATQAFHDLRYGYEGLALARSGHSAASTVQRLTAGDPDAPQRQLGIVDGAGRVASYTGSACLPWAGGMCGNGYAVQGNILAGAVVVEAMAASYETNAGAPFLERLVGRLLAAGAAAPG